MNGDILTDLDLAYSMRIMSRINHYLPFQLRGGTSKSVWSAEQNNIGELINFIEKPKHSFLVSMGIYMLNKEVLSFIPKNENFGFDTLMLKFLELKKSVQIKEINGYWLDIGRPDDYMQAIEEFEQMKSIFLHEK
ncbi:MAG: hypothetical protein IPM74_19730 [Crocinitomicaceae bacterium]|nr:hypothetical protein [Crocinitomicaceae bacterium]